MPSPDLTLQIDHTLATVPTEESVDGLEYLGGGGSSLAIVSGLDVGHALGYAGFNNDSYVNDAIKASGGGLVPQTLGTAVYQNIHLVAGTRLVIDAVFAPGDTRYNDESFALLKNVETSALAAKHIANVDDVTRDGPNWQTTFNIDATGDYNLLVGVADVGDKTLPSELAITAINIVVPGGQYSIIDSGLRLADNSVLRSDGSLQVGSTVVPGALATSGAAVVSGLQSLLAQQLISQDGAGIVSHDSGGIVSHDSGGLQSLESASIVSHDSGGFVSLNAAALSATQLAQIGASLAAANGAQARAYAAASASGLVSHNYGIMSLDGPGEQIPAGTAQPGGAPVPGLEVNATPGAVAQRLDDSSAIADLGGGRYAVAFVENQGSGASATSAIRVQAINADGTKFGDEITASPTLPATTQYGTPANELHNPSIASLGGGSFVVGWENGNNIRPTDNGSTGSDLFAQIFNADGSTKGSLISLDPQTSNAQYSNVKVSALSGGGFVAVWGQRPGASGANNFSSIHGQVYGADGGRIGSEFNISSGTLLADLSHPAVTATAGGGFAVAFQGSVLDPATGQFVAGIGAQSYRADGSATARNPSVVAISKTDVLELPSVAALPNGNIAVAWQDSGSGTISVYSSVLDPSLMPLTSAPALVTDNSTNGVNNQIGLSALADGRFVVGYIARSYPSVAVTGQIVGGDNQLSGTAFPLFAPGGGDSEYSPALLQLGNGTLIATSTHKFDALGASDVRALPFALGGSSGAQPTTAGQALATGSAVHGYVAGGTVFADANGNGIQDPGEASATTTADGAFALSPGAKGTLVLTGGTDLATGRAFTERYLAPSGSHAVNALTTLVQDVLAAGNDIGTAQMKVATALGLTADAALTNLDPLAAAASGSATAKAVLVTNALVADIADLAKAAGIADPLASFAASIASHQGFTAYDPGSIAALSAAGLGGQALTDASAIATAVEALLGTRATADGKDGTLLANDANRLEVVVQNGAADFAAALATGTTATVAAAYTGAALQAKFDAATVGVNTATVGVYRFFDTKYGTHFFTASTGERDDILKTRPDLVNEGVGLTAIDPASKDPNAAPVFRFFDTKYGTHFFTASASERDQVMANRSDLTFEGAGFYEHTTQQAGDTPVYRFFDKNFGTHFYTGDGGERATILSTRPDLVDEGIGFYAPKAAA